MRLPQKPAPGSFQDCFHRSGLATTHVKGQDADAKLFTKEAADLLLKIQGEEKTSATLLAATLMNENTHFDLHLGPNTKFNDSSWWDIGPFQLNQHYVLAAINKGQVSTKDLDLKQVWGMYIDPNGPFAGDPEANGRMAARYLNMGGGTDREKAIRYYGASRGPSYDSFAPLFDSFFGCYHGN